MSKLAMGYEEKASHIERAADEAQQQPDDGYAPVDIQKETCILEDPEWLAKQKKYLRKLDSILLPTISILYFFEYLDRGNIGVGEHLKAIK